MTETILSLPQQWPFSLNTLLWPIGIIAVLSIGILWLTKRFRRSTLPYLVRDTLNSPTEQAFFSVLRQCVDLDVMIACKVRIADVLEVKLKKRHANDQRWWRFFRLISSKHIDFVLCDVTTSRFLLAIELDDRSHQRRDRQRRDQFVDQVFASAGLPLLHFKASRRYDRQEIQDQIDPYLKPTETEQGR